MKRKLRRLLAVVLASGMMLAGTVEGFAASPSDFTFNAVSEVPFLTEYFSQFDQGNGNYVIPVDISSCENGSDLFGTFLSYSSNSSYVPIVFFSNRYSYTGYTGISSSFPYSGFSFYFFPRNNIQFQFSTTNGVTSWNVVYKSYNSSRIFCTPTFLFDPERNLFVLQFFSSGNFSSYVLGTSSTYPVPSLYFPDDFLYSLISSSNVYDASKFSLLGDISNISFVDYRDYVPPVSEQTLTVNYLYPNGTSAAESVTQTLEPGTEYSISSPKIEGYTPNIPLVTGTMPEEDLTIDVIYSMAFHTLTVKYQYADGRKAQEDVVLQYPAGFVYDVSSLEIVGYLPDKPSVSGTMPGNDLIEVVTYTGKRYTLTVDYRYEDGSQAAESYLADHSIGSSYSVVPPQIEGYHPDPAIVSGVMPGSNVTLTVTYRKDSGGSSGAGDSGAGDNEDPGGEGGGFSGFDPFKVGDPPEWSGFNPFKVGDSSQWSGFDPFKVGDSSGWSGFDPFKVGDSSQWSGFNPFKVGDSSGWSGFDPFKIGNSSGWSGFDPFKAGNPPAWSGFDPFKAGTSPNWSGYDPFEMPEYLEGY